MTQAPTASPPSKSDRHKPEPTRFKPAPKRGRSGLFVGGLIVVAVLVGGFFMMRGGGTAIATGSPEDLYYDVKRDDLRISVVESGSLESGNSIDIKSWLEGRVQILKLVPEGTFVKKGDVLCELDASELVERRIAQEITFERAKATYIAAQKTHEILLSDGESNTKQAELDVYFARIDLKKYEEGDWPQRKATANANITIAEEELKRARDKADWSQKLEEKGFITKQELEADQLAVTKREIDLNLAMTDLEVLEKYTREKELETYRSNLEEAEKALERVIKNVEREVVQSEADLKSKNATFELEKERFEKLDDQISKANIVAPQSGLLVYNNSSSSFGRSNSEPIEEGSTVRERQTIFKLPDVTNMIAKIKIHESAYDRVTENLKAYVKVDAFADEVFPARVKFVAPLPDSAQWWMNPDLKVYSAEVKLGGDTTRLKPGMSCSVEIEVDTLEDVLFIPIQAVFRKGKTSFCYVKTANGIVAKPVQVGLHNDKLIHIVEGLEEGDKVALAPPRGSEDIEVPEVESNLADDAPSDDEFPEIEEKDDDAGDGGGGTLTYEEYQALPDSEKRAASMRLSPEDRRRAMNDFMSRLTPEQRERMQSAMQNAGQGGSFGSESGGGGRPGGEGGGFERGGGEQRRGGGGEDGGRRRGGSRGESGGGE